MHKSGRKAATFTFYVASFRCVYDITDFRSWWLYQEGVSSFSSPHYLWRSLGSFSKSGRKSATFYSYLSVLLSSYIQSTNGHAPCWTRTPSRRLISMTKSSVDADILRNLRRRGLDVAFPIRPRGRWFSPLGSIRQRTQNKPRAHSPLMFGPIRHT